MNEYWDQPFFCLMDKKCFPLILGKMFTWQCIPNPLDLNWPFITVINVHDWQLWNCPLGSLTRRWESRVWSSDDLVINNGCLSITCNHTGTYFLNFFKLQTGPKANQTLGPTVLGCMKPTGTIGILSRADGLFIPTPSVKLCRLELFHTGQSLIKK